MDKIFTAGLFDELEALYPDSNAADGVSSYTVAACNGMATGVHIMLNGLTPGIPVSFEVSGPNNSYKFFELIPVPVEVNTGAKLRSAYLKNDVNETVIRRAPFYIYEAEKPVFNMIMPCGVSAALSFKTLVEYVKAKKTDVWTFTLKHNGAEQVLKLNVEAYPCAVPKADKNTFEYVNWMNFGNVAKYHGLQINTPEYFKMLDKYLRLAVYSRQNIINVPLEAFITYKDGEFITDSAAFGHFIDVCRKAGIQLFQGTGLCGRKAGLADNDDFYNSIDHSKIESSDEIAEIFKKEAFDAFDNGPLAAVGCTGETIPGPGEETLRKECRALYSLIKEHDLTDVWCQCMMDEPNDALADSYRVLSGIFKEEMPDIKRFEPVLPTHKLDGCVDVWCPSIDVYENDREYYDGRAAEGDKLFVYTCLTPGGNYTNRMLDMQRIRMVYLFWAPAKYRNIKGFLHWGLNQYPNGDDPYARSAVMFSEQVMEFHPKKAMFLPAGDFCIFYPGANMPYTTTRSEAHRIGLEDYELLNKLDDAVRDEIVASVFKGFADYDKDISAYRAARKKLLEASCK